MYLIDIDYLSNGEGKRVYGGHLDAYSFYETTCEKWFEDFSDEIANASGKNYLPVYRIGDGELRFLFGPRINWKNKPLRSILSFIKYGIFKAQWKTSWGEKYNKNDFAELSNLLKKYILQIADKGKLAIYWNENGLNAFTEYNNTMMYLFNKINISLNKNNYVPFHFGQALIAKHTTKIIKDKNILFVSGIDDDEAGDLIKNVKQLGAKSVDVYKCSKTSALTENYKHIKLTVKPDIVFVAAGIGAAKVLVELKDLNCPVIDIGSYLQVLSGKRSIVHAGFFRYPTNI